MASPGQRASLRVAFSTPPLRRCQVTAATARIVDMATLVAVSAYLFSRSGAAAVAVFGVARTAAPAVGTLLVTAAAGRSPPRRPLILCAAGAAGGTGAMALLVAVDGPIVAIHALAAATGIVLSCLRPLVTALLPSLITRPAELVATNAAAAFVDGTSTLAGPLLAGLALATVGAPAALWVSAALLATTTALMATQSGGPDLHQAGAQRPTRSAWAHDVVDGLQTLVANHQVRLVVVLSMSQTLVRGALNVLVVVLAIDSLDMGEGGVGLLLGAIGIGGLLGFPVAVRVARTGRMARALALALVLWGAPIGLAALTPGAGVALVLFAVIGVGNAIVDIASDTLLQRLVPRGELPRVLGAFDAALYAAMALGALVAERLLTMTGLTTGLVVTGLLLPILSASVWRRLHVLDAGLRDRDADVAMLQIHAIFSPLVMSTVDHVAERMRREVFDVGDVIIRKGDEGDRFLIIEEGAVEIQDDGNLLAVLGPGDGFGEMSLLDRLPRNATAIARSTVRVRSLHREDFLTTVASHHHAQDAATRLADERRRLLERESDGASGLR